MIRLMYIICGKIARILLSHNALVSHILKRFTSLFLEYCVRNEGRFGHVGRITVQVVLGEGAAIVLDLKVKYLSALLLQIMDRK